MSRSRAPKLLLNENRVTVTWVHTLLPKPYTSGSTLDGLGHRSSCSEASCGLAPSSVRVRRALAPLGAWTQLAQLGAVPKSMPPICASGKRSTMCPRRAGVAAFSVLCFFAMVGYDEGLKTL